MTLIFGPLNPYFVCLSQKTPTEIKTIPWFIGHFHEIAVFSFREMTQKMQHELFVSGSKTELLLGWIFVTLFRGPILTKGWTAFLNV
jgi:hypothetical protein